MSETKNYDVIVIGAGCGGLSAAASVAREGKKVLVIERQNTPGGFLGSFVRGRFEFDISLNNINADFEKSDCELRQLLDELGISHKISFSKIPSAYRLITKTESETIDISLPFGVENYIDEIEKKCPNSKKSLNKIFYIAEQSHRALKALCELPENPNRSRLNKIIKEFPDFAKTAPYSVDEVLRALNVPDKARYIVEAYWTRFGIDCTRLSFTHFADSLYCYLTYGSIIPTNRSHAIALALAGEIEDNGGNILYNNVVTRIKQNSDNLYSVVLKNGETYTAKHIINSISPNLTYGKLLKEKDVPKSAIKRTNARNFGPRAARVYLGLNRSPEDLKIKDYETIITTSPESFKQYRDMKQIDTNNNLSAFCLNIANPDCSPAGTTILCLETFYTDDCWADVVPEEYFNEKDLLAARLITAYEKSTGLTIFNSIEEIDVATPITFARYTGSPQGVTYGYSATEWDSLLPRFMNEKSENDIRNLYFCGGWSTQLSGVVSSISSGRNTAYGIIEDLGGTSNE